MSSAFLALIVTGSTVICAIVVIAGTLVRSACARREREALVSMDLLALEESVVVLLERLTSAGEEMIKEIDRRSAELKELLSQAEAKGLVSAQRQPVCRSDRFLDTAAVNEEIASLAAMGWSSDEIAKRTGLTCAETKLILSLQGRGKAAAEIEMK